jgi:hypothetical protein
MVLAFIKAASFNFCGEKEKMEKVSNWRHDNQHNNIKDNDTTHRDLFVTLSINDVQHKRRSA